MVQLAGGRVVQSPLVEPDNNIPIAYLSKDDELNNKLMDEFYEKMDRSGSLKDLFHENCIWTMVRSKNVPDLNDFR
jgi:hypothetical protein